MKCADCRNYKEPGEFDYLGECRRHPPVVLTRSETSEYTDQVTESIVTVWPNVGDENWCGEFDRRVPRRTATVKKEKP